MPPRCWWRFIALAATLSTVGTIPAAGIMLIFRIDKFMSWTCSVLVIFIGNSVATLFVAKWDKGLDVDRVRKVLNKEEVPDLPDEIDATENPLSIESTADCSRQTADFHHHEHAPEPEYSVDAAAQELAEAKATGVPAQSVVPGSPAISTTATWSATVSTTPCRPSAPAV